MTENELDLYTAKMHQSPVNNIIAIFITEIYFLLIHNENIFHEHFFLHDDDDDDNNDNIVIIIIIIMLL